MSGSRPAPGRFPMSALWPLAVAGFAVAVFWWIVGHDPVLLGETDEPADFTRHRQAVFAWSIAVSAFVVVLAALASFLLGREQAARRQTARSEQRLRDAIEGLPDGFVVYDADDRMVLWNDRYLSLLPFLRELPSLHGLSYVDVCRAGLRAGVFADELARNDPERWLAERVADHRNPPAEPVELPLSSGRWVLLRERHTADGGVVGVRTDVTELKRQEFELRTQQEQLQRTVSELERARRQLEEQTAEMASLAAENLAAMRTAETAKRTAEQARVTAERANRAKTHFLANMSHELRTPLNAIIGFSEIMKSELLGPILSERYREYIRDIHASGKHLLALISDVLDMSKIEADKFTLHLAPVDVTQVAEACSRMMQVRAVRAHLALVLDAQGDLNIVADERAINQVLFNLLSNAVKFTRPGGLVTLRARPDGDMIMLQVIDTGIGIKPESLPALGERFVQVDNVYTRSLDGTGLGLAISRGLAQLHGGSLQIDSVVGKGTTVTVRLPRNCAAKETSAA
jgi:two-component system, cell cycle sensor histidine kinase PleC